MLDAYSTGLKNYATLSASHHSSVSIFTSRNVTSTLPYLQNAGRSLQSDAMMKDCPVWYMN
ncbi:hypothetical protein HOLleu_28514 [Holothuria leucospilota]|uniref:Uncharacterized protein n=1 Tax=Holothuria leucospilota TaxID=206669 RepID=A0A9Q1BMH5_HOLLE|nr:hypothetical protein HOLleu_28514 [Holothuria leucospilota]